MNRRFFGWGILSGFTLHTEGEELLLEPGFALTQDGRELLLEQPLRIPLSPAPCGKKRFPLPGISGNRGRKC